MISAVICAAGKGTRANLNQNKILKELNGVPLLCHTLSAFSREDIGEILVVVSQTDETAIKTFLPLFPAARPVAGGSTRAESVYNGLKEAKGEIVLVHDGARPYVSSKLISDCIDGVIKNGSAVCALPVTDTVVNTCNGAITAPLVRETVYTVQTPQGYYKEKLLLAYEKAFQDNRTFTDESGVYAAYIEPPRLFIGEKENKKITFLEDFRFAERVGFGMDTHRFYTEDEGAPLVNFITLGGVRVPSRKILKAHSDGDVLVHALMDAMLSAAGLRDIGYYFPDTDEAYRGADSMQLLKEVCALINREGLAVQNASISVLAETPRLAPFIEEMKGTLAKVLDLSPANIGIAAGTNEKLGYVGEQKGITVCAAVLLYNKEIKHEN